MIPRTVGATIETRRHHLLFRARRLSADGSIEVGAYIDQNLVAVITRPMAGAKWFVHYFDETPSLKLRSLDEAVSRVFWKTKDPAQHA